MNLKIHYFNRKTQQIEEEKVYGLEALRFAYQNPLGKKIAKYLLLSSWFSVCFGSYQNTRHSTKKIPKFIEQYGIDLDEYEEGPFQTFNDFFIRRFKPGKRNFTPDENTLCAFAEGRYLGWNAVNDAIVFPVKGNNLRANDLITERFGKDKALLFEGGPLLICRLCPVDYHRFHFPDDGHVIESFRIPGQFHSVNPLALAQQQKIFIQNERHVSILKTKNFGYLAYIEVGAMCVGKIVQTHDCLKPFHRGEEKGYFLFGGSTVILIGEPKAWMVSEDICRNTERNLETFVLLGDAIAQK